MAIFIGIALPGLAFAAEAGKFQFVIGEIKVMSASGAERTPVKGDTFSAGETIVTGLSGSAQIRMTDGGLVAVRPDTQMKLDQYIFNGREDGSERKLVSLIKGGFRAITGLIGNRNKENYKILTPSATIGIRGTDHEAVVIPQGATGNFQVGTYDRVYRGATIIETDKGKLIVNPNQVGFTPGKGVAPILLPKIPDFFDTKAQRPDTAKDQQKEAKDSGGDDSRNSDTAKSDTAAKGTSTRSLSTLKNDTGTTSLKDVDSIKDTTSTLRSPIDSTSVKDLGSTTLKSDVLSTPISDTTLKSTTTSVLKDTSTATSTLKSDALAAPVTVPTTTLKSTEVLTAPVTSTVSTVKTPVTTTLTAPVTTVITTTPKITESVTVPTTTILKSTTTR